MPVSGPERPAKPYAPWAHSAEPVQPHADPAEQVSRLEAWPPQAMPAPAAHQHPVRVWPWCFLLLGLLIPLSALITGLWAIGPAREGDRQCVAIAIIGISMFVVLFGIGISTL